MATFRNFGTKAMQKTFQISIFTLIILLNYSQDSFLKTSKKCLGLIAYALVVNIFNVSNFLMSINVTLKISFLKKLSKY